MTKVIYSLLSRILIVVVRGGRDQPESWTTALSLLFLAACPSLRADETRYSGENRKVGLPYTERLSEGVKESPAASRPVSFDMAFIKAGKFVMGSEQNATESPPHEVEVKAFWMSTHEITADVFDLMYSEYSDWVKTPPVSGAPSSKAERVAIPGRSYYWPRLGGRELGPHHPLTGLTQFGAQRFCAWLSARTGRLYRLPTEAEWEYAARAGTRTRYFFGDDPTGLAEYAWFDGRFEDGSHPVGRKKPNPWGLYDVYGNVAEWTLDGWSPDYRAFVGKVVVDPWQARKENEPAGVIRGGDWTEGADRLRSAARAQRNDRNVHPAESHPEWFDPSDEGVRVGLRLVSPVEPDREPDSRPARSNYLKPFGWEEWGKELHRKRVKEQ